MTDLDEFLSELREMPFSEKIKILEEFTTSEVMNECYRRGAIRKFSASVIRPLSSFDNVDDYMKREEAAKPNAVMETVRENAEAISEYGAIWAKESEDILSLSFEMTAEIYVCKHPKTLKEEAL